MGSHFPPFSDDIIFMIICVPHDSMFIANPPKKKKEIYIYHHEHE